ncbi:hypothetical protein ACE6H2_019044 [Prunus campanulata]
MVCGMEIDFRKVFDMILQVAVDGNLRPDQMGKMVFVLTCLENFDTAGGSCWESDYEALQKNLRRKATVMQCHILCFGILTPTRRFPCLVVGDQGWP